MAAIDFPNNPTTNQQFTSAGRTWVWDGLKWLAYGSDVGPVGPAGPQGPSGPPASAGKIIAMSIVFGG